MPRISEPDVKPVCDHCRFEAGELYVLPQVRRITTGAPLEVCCFCYLRLRGIRPRRSARVTRAPASAQPE